MNEVMKNWTINSIRTLGGEIDDGHDNDCASVMVEQNLAHQLEIPEFSVLDFNAETVQDSTISIADLLQRFANIAYERGQFASVSLKPDSSTVWPTAKRASQFLTSANGKIVFDEARTMNQSYIIAYSRCSVVSDEKRLVLAGAAVNNSSFTAAPSLTNVIEQKIIELCKTSSPMHESVSLTERVSRALSASLQCDTQIQLQDFYQSINKRMERDSIRLFNYYNELYETARKPSGRKKVLHEQILANLEAIESDYRKKNDDLRIKYLTSISMEPVCLLHISIPCLVAHFDVFMSNRTIKKSIAWNPLTLECDSTVCDCCFKPVTVSHVCRGMHWLCDSCWKICPHCKREYCAMCRPGGCGCDA